MLNCVNIIQQMTLRINTEMQAGSWAPVVTVYMKGESTYFQPLERACTNMVDM